MVKDKCIYWVVHGRHHHCAALAAQFAYANEKKSVAQNTVLYMLNAFIDRIEMTSESAFGGESTIAVALLNCKV